MVKSNQKTPCYLLEENLGCYRRRKGSITPPSVTKRVWAHYPLFRVAEDMSPMIACFWTLMNVLGNAYKKVFYVKNIFHVCIDTYYICYATEIDFVFLAHRV